VTDTQLIIHEPSTWTKETRSCMSFCTVKIFQQLEWAKISIVQETCCLCFKQHKSPEHIQIGYDGPGSSSYRVL